MNAEDREAEDQAKAREKYIRDAVEASPDKIAIICVKDHHARETGQQGASKYATTDQNGWDHIAAAWHDKDGNLVFRDMTPSEELVGPYWDLLGSDFGSKNSPGTLSQLVGNYPVVEAIPLDLSARYGSAAPDKRTQFVDALEKELAPGKTYSFLQNGSTCSSSVGLAIASIDPEFGKFGTLDLRGVLSTSVDLFQQNFPKATAFVAQLFSDGPDALVSSIKSFIPELTLNTVIPYQVYDWAKEHSTLKYSPEDGKWLPSGQSAPAITDTSPIELQAAHSGLAAEGAAALQHAGVPDFMIKSDIFVFPALAAPEAPTAPGAPLELGDQSALHWGQTASHIALGDPVPQQDSLPAEAFLDAGLLGQSVAHHSEFLVI